LRASSELTWELIVKQAGSVSASAIGSIHESVLGSVIESVFRAYLGAYSQAGRERAIECNWDLFVCNHFAFTPKGCPAKLP